jgi:acyl-CoA dehydrogenase
MVTGAAVMGLADGPTEVHKTTVAKQVLRDYKATDDVWPSEWIPRKRDAARARFAEFLELEVGNQ